jgi:predicted nucleic acid-binding protein
MGPSRRRNLTLPIDRWVLILNNKKKRRSVRVILDAGAFVAIDRDDRAVVAMLQRLQQRKIPLLTSGAVVAQVYRNGSRQANLARTLAGVTVLPVDRAVGKHIGILLGRAQGADVVDGHVAMLTSNGDRVFTNDRRDIEILLAAQGTKAQIVDV